MADSSSIRTRALSFDALRVGDNYDRPFLARLWGYRDWHALGRGAVTPAKSNKIVLFITREKQRVQVQYEDHFDGDVLKIEGETNHGTDDRVIGAKAAGDEIHLFYRQAHHSPFTYYGEVHLRECQRHTDRPSRFVFDTKRTEVIAAGAIEAEKAAQGTPGADYVPEPEGRKKLRQHVEYERSRKNRAEAIRIHGTVCLACGFDFDAVYGEDLARSYIQVHHVRSITKTNGFVDPKTDLAPLCANCHSMVHRNRDRIMPVQELRDHMKIQAKRPLKSRPGGGPPRQL